MSARVRRWCSAVGLVMAVSVAVGCGGGGVPVQSPATVPAGRTIEQTEQAILDALPRRGWTAESVQPGRIVSFLSVRSHLLRVEIRYDAQQVGIYYVDSDNLAAHVEENGVVYAHKKVNAWIKRLATDISASLAVAPRPGSAGGVTHDGPAPAPLPGAAQSSAVQSGAPSSPAAQ